MKDIRMGSCDLSDAIRSRSKDGRYPSSGSRLVRIYTPTYIHTNTYIYIPEDASAGATLSRGITRKDAAPMFLAFSRRRPLLGLMHWVLIFMRDRCTVSYLLSFFLSLSLFSLSLSFTFFQKKSLHGLPHI